MFICSSCSWCHGMILLAAMSGHDVSDDRSDVPAVTLAVLVSRGPLSRAQPLVIDGETLPNGSSDSASYRYHDSVRASSTVRPYLLQEQRPRTYLMCPQGFAIEQVSADPQLHS